MNNSEYEVNKGQIAKIHVLLRQMGLGKDKAYKEELVKQYTDGRETSTTGLSWKEAQDMIAGLERVHARPAATRSEDEQKADRKRKRILWYAHQMGHELPGRKVDMEWVNGWCRKHGYLHKELNAYTLAELSKLVWQMEQVYKDYLKGV